MFSGKLTNRDGIERVAAQCSVFAAEHKSAVVGPNKIAAERDHVCNALVAARKFAEAGHGESVVAAQCTEPEVGSVVEHILGDKLDGNRCPSGCRSHAP